MAPANAFKKQPGLLSGREKVIAKRVWIKSREKGAKRTASSASFEISVSCIDRQRELRRRKQIPSRTN